MCELMGHPTSGGKQMVPFFLNYDFHVAHEPIEVPRVYFDRQALLLNASGVGDYQHRRTTYQGMVKFMDDVIGNLTRALVAKGMWNDTLIFFSSDNGGPVSLVYA